MVYFLYDTILQVGVKSGELRVLFIFLHNEIERSGVISCIMGSDIAHSKEFLTTRLNLIFRDIIKR